MFKKRDELAEHRGFLGQWKYSAWYYNDGLIFTQTHRMYNTKNDPWGKLWTLDAHDISIIYRLILGKTCTTLGSDVDNGGDYACVGAECIWEISVPLNFVVNLKLF